MPTLIELPQVGESVTEGVITKWLKQPGERVQKYDPLVEVMTDKVNMEVPSPYTGTLVKTLVAEGDTVPMGDPIAEMDVEEVAEQAQPAGTSAESVDSQHSFQFVDSVRSVGPTGSGEGGQGRPDALQDADVRAHAPDAQRLSPLVRRLVAEHGIEVGLLIGTGVGGRITKDDVERHLAERDGETAQPELAQPPASATRGDRSTGTLALTPLRKTIAEHLARSAREIPAAWSMVEVDVTGLVHYRDARKASFEREFGLPLSYLPFAANAVAQALVDNPLLNGRWDGDHITLHDRVDLGIAVSTDKGLIVPVVHEADLLNPEGLALRIHEVVDAARNGTLKLEDVQGGTFTLNNTGALGSVLSVPIINHPQAAIMTTQAIVKRPVVIENDAVAVRPMMNVCLSFDHRVCDGAEAGRFLEAVKSRLQAIDQDSDLL